MPETSDELLENMALIVTSFVEHNSLPGDQLPRLIADVHGALDRLTKGGSATAEPPTPAVDPKRSVKSDHIICLEDGKRFKSLKRHLGAQHGMTPDEYRRKWDLPRDYPMVAPEYSTARSELARSSGLGLKRKGRRRG